MNLQQEAFRAWCRADGVIQFGTDTPDGAIEILRGDEAQVRETLDVAARHGYAGGVLLVPGVPEAKNLLDGRLALQEWVNWFSHRPVGSSSLLDWNRKLEAR